MELYFIISKIILFLLFDLLSPMNNVLSMCANLVLLMKYFYHTISSIYYHIFNFQIAHIQTDCTIIIHHYSSNFIIIEGFTNVKPKIKAKVKAKFKPKVKVKVGYFMDLRGRMFALIMAIFENFIYRLILAYL